MKGGGKKGRGEWSEHTNIRPKGQLKRGGGERWQKLVHKSIMGNTGGSKPRQKRLNDGVQAEIFFGYLIDGGTQRAAVNRSDGHRKEGGSKPITMGGSPVLCYELLVKGFEYMQAELTSHKEGRGLQRAKSCHMAEFHSTTDPPKPSSQGKHWGYAQL